MRTLPAPRPVLWPLRPLASASHSMTERDGQVVITIEHAPLGGVTAEMVRWWYGHVPGTMAYAGGTVRPRRRTAHHRGARPRPGQPARHPGAGRGALGRGFPPRRIGPWIRHHVEEIGNLENFLPDLFRTRAGAEP